MKITKFITGILLSLIVVSNALAYDPEDKKKCLQHPDKFVWIESKGACIPVNPCLDKWGDKYSAYCVKIFENFAHVYMFHDVIQAYLLANDSELDRMFATEKIDNKYYTPCRIEPNDYLVFQYEMPENYTKDDVRLLYNINYCIAIGGEFQSKDDPESGGVDNCKNVSERRYCKVIMGDYNDAEKKCIITDRWKESVEKSVERIIK